MDTVNIKDLKIIEILYWSGWCEYSDLEYKHHQVLPYSIQERDEILEDVISKGYYIAFKCIGDKLIIFIDDRRFSCR